MLNVKSNALLHTVGGVAAVRYSSLLHLSIKVYLQTITVRVANFRKEDKGQSWLFIGK